MDIATILMLAMLIIQMFFMVSVIIITQYFKEAFVDIRIVLSAMAFNLKEREKIRKKLEKMAPSENIDIKFEDD